MATGQTVEVRSHSDGSLVWSQQVSGSNTGAIAVDSAGDVVAYACSAVARFDSGGHALASWPLPATANACPGTMFSLTGNLVFDSQDDLYVYVAGGSASVGTVTRFDPTGIATSFSAPSLVVTALNPANLRFVVIAPGANGHVVTAIPDFPNVYITPLSGVTVASFAPTGVADWTLEKTGDGEEVPFDTYEVFDGVIASDLACTSTGLCALIGEHYVSNGGADPTSSNWIELLQQ